MANDWLHALQGNVNLRIHQSRRAQMTNFLLGAFLEKKCAKVRGI